MFTELLSDLLDYKNNLPGLACLVVDMNIHIDIPIPLLFKQTFTIIGLCSFMHIINKNTHRCGNIIDWAVVRPDNDIHRKSTVADSLESDHYCNKFYFDVSVPKLSTTNRIAWNITNIDRASINADLSSVTELSSVENANQCRVFFAHCTG